MSACGQRAARWAHQMLSCVALCGAWELWRGPHIAWKLSSPRARWSTHCQDACAKRIARDL
eukprot:285037-Prymnesium_polylepis.1